MHLSAGERFVAIVLQLYSLYSSVPDRVSINWKCEKVVEIHYSSTDLGKYAFKKDRCVTKAYKNTNTVPRSFHLTTPYISIIYSIIQIYTYIIFLLYHHGIYIHIRSKYFILAQHPDTSWYISTSQTCTGKKKAFLSWKKEADQNGGFKPAGDPEWTDPVAWRLCSCDHSFQSKRCTELKFPMLMSFCGAWI